jgi:sugar O-acyltransferase (sialic acid O-acetyltransferase NeuD family)
MKIRDNASDPKGTLQESSDRDKQQASDKSDGSRRPKRVLIIGAGGHARVIADAILCNPANHDVLDVVGFLDDDPAYRGERALGKPILGTIADLQGIPHDAVVIGIGENETRRRLFNELVSRGEHPIAIIHPKATVAQDVPVGVGSVIFAGVVVNTGAAIREDVILNTGCSVDHNSVVDAHAHICPGAHLGGTVRIGEGAFIGIGSAIIHNRCVGEWATIGGGAVVIRDVAPKTTVVGVPAKAITPSTTNKPQSGDQIDTRQLAPTQPGLPRRIFRTSMERSDERRIAVYGAGGFGREIAAAMRASPGRSDVNVVCFVDDDENLRGKIVDDVPVLNMDTFCRRFPQVSMVCAIAEGFARQKAVKVARLAGVQFSSFVHESAMINASIKIGEGCVVSAGCILTANVKLGSFVIINLQSTLGHDVTVGDYSTIGPGVRVGGFVDISELTRIGMGALIVNGVPEKPIIVGKGANIGMGACVLRSVLPGQTVFGVPARPVPLETNA